MQLWAHTTASMDSLRWAWTFIPYPTSRPSEEELRRLASGDYAVIYITEALAAQIPHEIARYREQVLPAIIQIPGVSGNTGAGITGVKKSVEQAVGSDILFGND